VSIVNELSSEIAIAMLVKGEGSFRSAKDVADVLLTVYSALRSISIESRRRRCAKLMMRQEGERSSAATPGSH
jgi:hypothetical protein